MRNLIGRRVLILQGMPEFLKKTGTIIGEEMKYYRVKLDEPVEVPGVGKVTDDLWMRDTFKLLRIR